MSAPRLKTAAGLASFSIFTILLALTKADLTPPYFNLALNKSITASATCGEDKRELYCKLVGANTENDEKGQSIIQGQSCDYCYSKDEEKKHPPEYAVDGLDTWWQSPSLAKSMKYNEVNLTIDLGQEFHVAYIFIRMGNSPRPGLWILEKSKDYGKTYKTWQYFSDSAEECARLYGRETLEPITRDDSVICSTEYSQIVPLEGGEIPIQLLTSRPSASHYFNSTDLQEWTRATNVRFRFLRTKSLLGHLMSIGSDSTVTRRFYYSIKDISIGGRCMCNGHAEQCAPDEEFSKKLRCVCQHNTCGEQCAECCSGYQQKKWKISQEGDRFSCEECNCHNHSRECTYDPEVDRKRLSLDIHGRFDGGGVCQNCKHNTEGINCNKCKDKFYRPWSKSWGDIDVCKPCNCDLHFSTGNCAEGTGACECRFEFNPPACDSCRLGYFDYPDCKPCPCNINGTTTSTQCLPQNGKCFCKYNYAGEFCEKCADGYYSNECIVCECNPTGSVSSVCDKENGNCTCKTKFAGQRCDQCQAGFFNYPTCQYCNCDTSGTEPSVCDLNTGECKCKEGFGGPRCDTCIAGYYMETVDRTRVCVPCNCSLPGSSSAVCAMNGKCSCISNFGGKQCDQCSPGHYKYPDCLPCNCDPYGSIGLSCDDNGQCQCKSNFDKLKCDTCKELFYNYPACEECKCDPSGVIASFAGCGTLPRGELCQCKERVQGRICNDCRPLFWNLQEYNPRGCEECNCFPKGTQGGIGVCDTKTGQCPCKVAVGSLSCNQCLDGFYNLQVKNVFGCTDCDCDVGGATDNTCDKMTGQCKCHARVTGRRCDSTLKTHYFPTLHEMQYELEDGRTPTNEPVRYNFDLNAFPGFSWKSYAEFSKNQKEVINDVLITKSSLYRMILRFVNNNPDQVTVNIVITPEQQNGDDTEQSFVAVLKPSPLPQFVTVSGEKGLTPSPFVMNIGKWEVKIKTDSDILIDYFVLIPAPYYEGTVLTKDVMKPCTAGVSNICRQFAYPLLPYPQATAKNVEGGSLQYLNDKTQLNSLVLDETSLIFLKNDQSQLTFNLYVNEVGTKYVLVIQYVTPANTTEPVGGIVSLGLISDSGAEYGSVLLEECPYSTLCRQVIVDELLQEQLFYIDKSANKVTLTADPQTLAAIHSVVAIPAKEWHLDFIRPKHECVSINGGCSSATFITDIVGNKIDIEPVQEAQIVSSPTHDNTSAILLKPSAGVARIEGKVTSPGRYVFVLHYYQPDFPAMTVTVNVKIDGQSQSQPATLAIAHCPSQSGCRSYVQHADGTNYININENFTLTFRETAGKGLYIYYVLLIPAEDYKPKVLSELNPLDHTREFITYCGQNNYYVDTESEGFCRDSIFSIVTNFNGGAYPCRCDTDGSLSYECNQFGGQCPCRPNVIGRTCTQCRSGYYGFPNCQPCNCPSGCADDGTCICPRNVEGEQCERCTALTYGFNQWSGCLECNCNRYGVLDNLIQCDLDNGSCTCLPNVIGRTCSHCVAGNFYFPDCQECDCNRAGTTVEVCDQNTAQCYCKTNVIGETCNTCATGFFNLEGSNPDGCTKCFCFGKTSRCSSAQLFWAPIFGMEDWFLANIIIDKNVSEYRHSDPPELHSEGFIGAELNADSHEKIVYFGTPLHFLGQKLASYGGFLNYTVLFVTGTSGNAIRYPDIILKGPFGYLLYYSIEQPPSAEYWSHSVQLIESEFTTVDGKEATREQFLTTLQSLEGIYIRATYWENGVTTRLRDVSLDVGISEYWQENAVAVTSVEQCQCPAGYKGLSCEQCAEGFYRINKGAYGGYCQPCECHGHATTCDVNTGECINCGDNTMGDHCEMCIRGYHGDATRGHPSDCMICACPLPIISNNFADSCKVSADGSLIQCVCEEGYDGTRCEGCAPGYYGNPELEGDYCKPCNCSGNIDATDKNSCDTTNGNCLKCMNHTGGTACNLCAPGFYGDAVILKNCQTCDCDKSGTRHCDSFTGKCECHDRVLGDRCDRCEHNTWGIRSGRGCSPCECGIAALDTQCDIETGQCQCAFGVTGKRCDQCASGYWNYNNDGCEHCNCNTGYSVGFVCNTNTGQCECLPGAVGDKCEKCPYRWVLIPGERCAECDSCTHALLDSVEHLNTELGPIAEDFKSKANSYFTTQRLNYISDTVAQLRPKVDAIDPNKINLAAVTEKIEALETDAKNLDRRAEYGSNDAKQAAGGAFNLTEDAKKVNDDLRDTSAESKRAVQQVKDLATSLEVGEQPKIDSAIEEARLILGELKEKDLTPKLIRVDEQLQNASALEERMKIFTQPVYNQIRDFESLKKDVENFEGKLLDLLNYTKQAQDIAKKAEDLNNKNKASKFDLKIQNVNNINTDAWTNILTAAEDLNKGDSAKNTILDLIGKAIIEKQNSLNTQTDDVMKKIEDRIDELYELETQAKSHESKIINEADQLNHLMEILNKNAKIQDAYKAANAYTTIIEDIKEGREAANNALNSAQNLTVWQARLTEASTPASNKSAKLKQDSEDLLTKVNLDLQSNLDAAKLSVDHVKGVTQEAGNSVDAIILSLATIPQTMTTHEELRNYLDNPDPVQARVNQVKSYMKELENVPDSVQLATNLPKTVDDINKDIRQIESQIQNIDTNKPVIDDKYNRVHSQSGNINQLRVDANGKVDRLKRQIEQAKNIAGSIKVGVQFEDRSTLQPETPANVDEMGLSTHVSAYFKTKKENGFLLYLGNEEGTKLRRTTSDDYMAIEILNGYPYLVIDIGDGVQKINSQKKVSDNNWYQVIVDRVGKNVKFTIKEELSNGTEVPYTTAAVIPGQKTIFNLDKKQSKLLVGGYSRKLQNDIRYNSFEGEVEELVIGDTPVGLWNFVEANNIKGANERDKFRNKSPTTGYRFHGEGYVEISASQYVQPETNEIYLEFKTFAAEGLLYLISQGSSFLSIEMREGHVFMQFRLGGDVRTLGTEQKFNDGRFHRVKASRTGRKGSLRLDDYAAVIGEADGSETVLPAYNVMYFGGYSPEAGFIEITRKLFDGCIDAVKISGIPVDLTNNIKAIGVTAGCQFAYLVSLDGANSYMRYNDVSFDDLQLNLKFKTSQPDALIFYITNRDQTSGVSLALVGGKLKLISQGEILDSGSTTYNDDQWHVVTVTHNTATLSLVVDDYDSFTSDARPRPLHFIKGYLFLGGAPPLYVLVARQVASRTSFVGCFGDATFNGRVVNFTNPFEASGVTFGRCGSIFSSSGVIPDNGGITFEQTISPDLSPLPTPPSTTESDIASVITWPESTVAPLTPATTTIKPPKTQPKTKRPPPQTHDGCVLEHNASFLDITSATSYRFGTRNDSHIEYSRVPVANHDDYDFSVNFKTSDPDGGLIFYASEPTNQNLVALYMKNGQVHLIAKCGLETIRLKAANTYNDGGWHQVMLSKTMGFFKIVVNDDSSVDQSKIQCVTNVPLLVPPFYLGGLPKLNSDIASNLQEVYSPFMGCLKHLKMYGQSFTDKHTSNVIPCTEDDLEYGAYFAPGGGYIKMMENFKVEIDISISLEIKPRKMAGLLVALVGRKHHMILELIDNEVVLRVDNGKGEFEAHYKLSNQFHLCDGNWHKIQAIKSRHVASVAVDGHFSEAGVGTASATKNRQGLFLVGGMANPHQGHKSKQSFQGCIRNISVKESVMNIPLSGAFGNVTVGFCPTN